jgi:hypothetical protein
MPGPFPNFLIIPKKKVKKNPKIAKKRGGNRERPTIC